LPLGRYRYRYRYVQYGRTGTGTATVAAQRRTHLRYRTVRVDLRVYTAAVDATVLYDVQSTTGTPVCHPLFTYVRTYVRTVRRACRIIFIFSGYGTIYSSTYRPVREYWYVRVLTVRTYRVEVLHFLPIIQHANAFMETPTPSP